MKSAATGARPRLQRIVGVTLGLVLTGAVVGALCGAIALSIALSIGERTLEFFDRDIWAIGGGFGAAIGAVVAPLFSWLLLRYVPLGKAILHSAIGTIIGGALFFALPPGPLIGALLGFGLAAGRLAYVNRASQRPRIDSGSLDGSLDE
jgi:hypothetical protein